MNLYPASTAIEVGSGKRGLVFFTLITDCACFAGLGFAPFSGRPRFAGRLLQVPCPRARLNKNRICSGRVSGSGALYVQYRTILSLCRLSPEKAPRCIWTCLILFDVYTARSPGPVPNPDAFMCFCNSPLPSETSKAADYPVP